MGAGHALFFDQMLDLAYALLMVGVAEGGSPRDVDAASSEATIGLAGPVVLEAGRVVSRLARGSVRVTVMPRDADCGDSTLPKDHIELGEPFEAAAVHAVRVEPGSTARPTSLVTATTCQTNEELPLVLYWNMDAVAVDGAPVRSEVVVCEWLSYAEVRAKLTDQRESDVVAKVDGGAGGKRRYSLRTMRDPQHERLGEAIALTRLRLAASHESCAASPARWQVEASGALDQAAAALSDGAVDRGWALVHLAHELEVASYDDEALTAEATAIAAEVSSPKFSGWRKAAILSQLEPVLRKDPAGDPALKPTARRTWLMEAVRNRNEVYSNEYRNIAIVRRYQAILLTIAMVILVGSLVGAAFTNPEFENGADAWWAALGAALSGALGGITSALQRTARRSVERIPERLGSLVSSLSRPAIGAIAGVTVFLAVRAGVTQTATQQQVAYLLLLAFGAGFTERLVVRDPREEAAYRTSRIETTPAQVTVTTTTTPAAKTVGQGSPDGSTQESSTDQDPDATPPSS